MYRDKKVIVVMPAYNAEKTLQQTWDEVMEQGVVDRVIVVDDASSDTTTRLAETLPNTSVYTHAENRGYGANQKTCYAAALAEDADIVIMVHPDYQYTPKLIPAMASMIGNGVYSCVLGSRILGGRALQGDMPVWKYVANRALTFVENLLLGSKLSEFHTGYRAYSREILEELPLEHNSDDFVFDNQVLAQIHWLGHTIAEVSCPTLYFPEASSINLSRSIRYGLGCLWTGLVFRLARMGLVRSELPQPHALTRPATPRSKRWLAFCGLLIVATFAAYASVSDNEFVYYDDDIYVTHNAAVSRGLSMEGVRWAFTTSHAGNWHPITWLSHMLDTQLWGLDPRAHHLTSVALHALNALVLFGLLCSLTGAPGRSAVVAALFALHPVQVESVAWVAERKSLLSTLFGLLCIGAYARYARRGSRAAYAATFGLMALSLMAKPMLVTLPFVLLLLDLWPLRRVQGPAAVAPARLVAEKLPLLGLSLLSSLATLATQSSAMIDLDFRLRAANALVSYARYLGALLWPRDLAVLYPHPEHWPAAAVLGATLLIAGLSVLALREWRQRPWVTVGWLWFLGVLVPALGIVQVGVQAMADRYAYVPLIGPGIIGVWGAADVLERWRAAPSVRAALACGVLLALGLATHAQVGHWRDTSTLFERALRVTGNNPIAHTELGVALAARGRLEEAIDHYRRALRLFPDSARAHANLGWALGQRGELERGIGHMERALQLQPDLREGNFHLAVALERAGRLEEAILRHRDQLGLDTTHHGSLLHLARLLASHPDDRLRNGALALRLATRACNLEPCTRAWEMDVFAIALMENGRMPQAVRMAGRALDAAREAGETALAASIERRLRGYERGQAHRLGTQRPR